MPTLSWKKARLNPGWRDKIPDSSAPALPAIYDTAWFRVLTDPLLVDCASFRHYTAVRDDYRDRVTVAAVLPVDNAHLNRDSLVRENNRAGFYTNPRFGTEGLSSTYTAYRINSPGTANWLHPDIRTDARLSIGWLWREAIWAMTNDLPSDNYGFEFPHSAKFFPLSIFQLSNWELLRSDTTTITNRVKESTYAYRRTCSDSNRTADPAPVDRRS